MAWTSEQAAIQALMRGRVALSAFVEDITRAIDVLAPSGSAEHGCPGCECACHRGAIASEACVCRGVGGGMVAVPREVFAEAAAAWCACNCPTQIVGQPGPHRGECLEMRTLLFPVRGNSGEPPTLGERLTRAIDDAIEADRVAQGEGR